MQNAWFNDLQNKIEMLREAGEDYLIISVGVRGPNVDMPEGNAVATITIGDDTATAEAKYLCDAISLARVKAQRAREARAKKIPAAEAANTGGNHEIAETTPILAGQGAGEGQADGAAMDPVPSLEETADA